MHKPAKDKHFIKQPWYEGGPKAMKQFVADHLSYPPEALAQRVEGTLTVRFDIDHNGEVTDAKIIGHRLGNGCEEEAIRLVKSMKFKVDTPRGLRVVHHKTIQIHFRLPQVVVEAAQMQVQYNYVTPTVSPATAPNDSYSYNVTIG